MCSKDYISIFIYFDIFLPTHILVKVYSINPKRLVFITTVSLFTFILHFNSAIHSFIFAHILKMNTAQFVIDMLVSFPSAAIVSCAIHDFAKTICAKRKYLRVIIYDLYIFCCLYTKMHHFPRL